MTTVELFAGIGGFRIAADGAGHQTIWANDRCPKACSVYRDRFGEGALHEGDFAQITSAVPKHDLLTAGFPCQPFSSAGKKKGIRDARGTLFQLIVDVLRERQPPYFVLENVKRLLAMEQGRHFAVILGALADLEYSVEWRLLNAVDFGLAQNRQRIFLVGVRLSKEQILSCLRESLAPIRLASAEDLACLGESSRDRLFCWDRWEAISRHGKRFPGWGLAIARRMWTTSLDGFSLARPRVTLGSILQPMVSEEFDFTESTLAWLKSNTVVDRFVNGVEIVSNQLGGARMGYTIFGINGVAPTLTSTTSRHYERYKIGDRYRRLTNVEYARLQGFPDDHCRAVSVYDQYALFGNAAPPPMAAWVIERLGYPGVARSEIPGPMRRGRERPLSDAS